MKKRVLLLLIFMAGIVLLGGCGGRDCHLRDMETETAETVGDAGKENAGECLMADDSGNGGKEKRGDEKEVPEETEPEEMSVSLPAELLKENSKPAPVQSGQDTLKKAAAVQEEVKPDKDGLEETKEAGAKPEEPGMQGTGHEEPKPEETWREEFEEEEKAPAEAVQEQQACLEQAAPQPAAVSYNPDSVCSQAIAKCQAGGMVTTVDNLAAMLSEGRITQEEYDSYYPYDGLGYYSVFVETDLNKASTTSGRKLGSGDGIAEYIAEMMLLETEPVFYIEYAGVYSLNGTDFYEFRCYR